MFEQFRKLNKVCGCFGVKGNNWLKGESKIMRRRRGVLDFRGNKLYGN